MTVFEEITIFAAGLLDCGGLRSHQRAVLHLRSGVRRRLLRRRAVLPRPGDCYLLRRGPAGLRIGAPMTDHAISICRSRLTREFALEAKSGCTRVYTRLPAKETTIDVT